MTLNLTLTLYKTGEYSISVYEADGVTPQSLAGGVLKFSAVFGAFGIVKNSPSNGITITNAAGGANCATLLIDPADTALLSISQGGSVVMPADLTLTIGELVFEVALGALLVVSGVIPVPPPTPPPPVPIGGLLQANTVTLTQADILALDTVPFVLVPAQGANNVIFPFAFRWRVQPVSTAYVDGGEIAGAPVWWENSSNPFSYIASLAFAPDAPGFLTDTASFLLTFFQAMIDPANPTAYTNVPLVLQTFQGDTLNRGPVTAVAVNIPGTTYAIGDLVNEGPGSAFLVTAIGGGGEVTALTDQSTGVQVAGGTGLAAANTGNLVSAKPSAGQGGNRYANGDIGQVVGAGDGQGQYTVLTSLDGVVLTVAVSGGRGYGTQTGIATQTEDGEGDNTLQLDISAATGSGLTVDVTVTPGDGTLTVTTWYAVAPK